MIILEIVFCDAEEKLTQFTHRAIFSFSTASVNPPITKESQERKKMAQLIP